MSWTRVAQVVGWAIVAASAGVWVRIVAIGMSTECTSGCLEDALWAVAWGLVTVPGVGVAGRILAFAYERDPAPCVVSSPVGLLAKVERLLACGSLLLAIASLVLIFLVGPLALVVALWNLAAGQMASTVATQLDRRVSPGVLSNASQWIVATAVCLVVLAAGGLAVVNSLKAGPVFV